MTDIEILMALSALLQEHGGFIYASSGDIWVVRGDNHYRATGGGIFPVFENCQWEKVTFKKVEE